MLRRLFILNTSEHSCTVFLLRNLWLFVGKQKLTIHLKKNILSLESHQLSAAVGM